MACDFKDDLVAIVFQELHVAQLVRILSPVAKGIYPPASCLIDVHHGEEFFVWACVFELLLKPIKRSSHLILVTLVVFVIEGQAFYTEKGQLAWNEICSVPATLL